MKRTHKSLLALLIVLGALLIARALLPFWVAHYLNDKLAHMGDYRGHLQSVDLALWRGAYRIKQFEIRKRDAAEKEFIPFLDAPLTDISVSWRALFKGAIVGRIEFVNPELNFVDGASDKDDQAGQGVDWRDTLQGLLPIQLNEVVVRDGAIHLRNFQSTPKVDVYMSELDATASNLTNANRDEAAQVARLDATALVLGGAPFEASMQFDPLGELTDFDLEIRALNVALPQLDDFMRAYGGIDAESGTADLVLELNADRKQVDGYAKLLLRELDIVSWKQDVQVDRDNPFSVAWESLVAGVMVLLSNQPNDQFATRVPIRGAVDAVHGQVLPALISIVRNAFVEAMRPNFEDQDGSSEAAEADAKPAVEEDGDSEATDAKSADEDSPRPIGPRHGSPK